MVRAVNLEGDSGAPGAGVETKVKPISELSELLVHRRNSGMRIVQSHGVFDLIHPGHIRHLKAARAQGDILVVTVTADRFVNKGPGRPAFNEGLRAEFLATLECVDYVAVNHAENAVEAIRALRPDVYVKGSDYTALDDDPTGNIHEEKQAVLGVGGRIHFTDEITFSSSQLLNAHFDMFPPETERWLSHFRSRFSLDEVLEYIERAAALTALVVGEPIIDEYLFCEGLGKSSKDPILALRYRSTESHAGGSLAVANHLGGLCGTVGLLAQVGELQSRDEFIRRQLLPNVKATLPVRRNAPTIHKRRFVDAHTGARIFELYIMEDTHSGSEDEAQIITALSSEAGDYDFTVVADYGHGMMTPNVIAALVEQAKYLVVNTQANAGNRGFNTIAKYPRADYVCLAGHEVELETRMRHAAVRDLIEIVARRIDCPRFTVTRGKSGSVHLDRGGEFVEAPPFADYVTDRVGAGDAVLAVTAPLVFLSAPWDIVGLVANIAGSQMVAELGNRVSINQASLIKAVTSLLK